MGSLVGISTWMRCDCPDWECVAHWKNVDTTITFNLTLASFIVWYRLSAASAAIVWGSGNAHRFCTTGPATKLEEKHHHHTFTPHTHHLPAMPNMPNMYCRFDLLIHNINEWKKAIDKIERLRQQTNERYKDRIHWNRVSEGSEKRVPWFCCEKQIRDEEKEWYENWKKGKNEMEKDYLKLLPV